MTLRFKGGIIPRGTLRANAGPTTPPWYDEDASVVIDASGLAVGEYSGKDILTNYVATDLQANSIIIQDVHTRSDPTCIEIGVSRGISFYRIDSTLPWTNEGNDWTIEYVFKLKSGYAGLDTNNFTSVSDRIQCSAGERTDQIGLSIYNGSGGPKRQGGYVNVSDSAWHHAAYTFKVATNEWKFYLDGILRYTTNWTPGLSTKTPEAIGKYQGTSYIDRYQLIPRLKYTGNFTPEI